MAFYVKQGVNVDLTSVAPKVYSDDSYKFTNWDKPLKGIFNADTDITALWQYNAAGKFKVMYIDDEGIGYLYHTEYVKHGESPKEVPEHVKKEGYEFLGWQIDGAGKIYSNSAIKNLEI